MALFAAASRLQARAAARRIWRRCCSVALALCVWVALGARAQAHDLAIDQVMLWPDRVAGELRGELTFDPELTRSKDVRPSEEDARRAIEFLNANLELTLDARRVVLHFEVRELWVRGGATLGDVVRFSTPLPASASELRLHARAFKALVVSVQRVPGRVGGGASVPATVETTSWLLGKDDWTPSYHLDSGWREPGWRAGGPDAFNDVSPSGTAASDTAATDAAASGEAASGPGAGSAGASAPPQHASERDGDAPGASSAGLAARFIRLGFEHILPCGFDHVLFVAGLVLSRARRYRQVLVSLSLFTLAHTLTLALGHFQLVQVSPRVVEPLIAFSIFVLGVDNLRASGSVEAPAAARHLVVFSFGLVHGLGFASALSQLAFDPQHIVLALFSFNLGVELGQVVVVALLGLLLLSIRRWREIDRYATLAGSAAIAASGLVLAIDRVMQMDDAAASMPAVSPPAAVSPSPKLTSAPASDVRSPLSRSLTRSLDRSL